MKKSERWLRAASRYEIARAIAAQAVKPEPQQMAVVTHRGPSVGLMEAAHGFMQFLKSDEGKAALYLLERADFHITLYSELDSRRAVTGTFLDHRGLFDGAVDKISNDHIHISELKREYRYRQDFFKPASAYTAIENAYNPRGGVARHPTENNPSKFLDWLKGKIDEISNAAPTLKNQNTSVA